MSERITDEMVEAAAARMYHRNAMDNHAQGESLLAWSEIGMDRQSPWRRLARAALESALPLIVAGEREMCAHLADLCVVPTFEAAYNRACRDIAYAIRSPLIASAIRADKGGE